MHTSLTSAVCLSARKARLAWRLVLAVLALGAGLGSPAAQAQNACTSASGYVAIVPTMVCPGGAARVGANLILVGNPTYVASWQASTNGGAWTTVAGATTTSFMARPLVTTAYRFVMTCPSGARILGQATLTVEGADAGPPIAVCSGSVGQLGAAPVAGTTYTWSPATGLSSATIANPTVSLTNTGTYATGRTYTLSTTNAQGCTSTQTVQVTVNPAAVVAVAASGPTTFCQGGAVTLTATGRPGSTFRWNTGATTAALLVTGTGSYSVTATAPSGCAATSAATDVTVLAPVATAGPALHFCGSGTGQLGAAPVAGTTYSWSPATGLSDAASANPTVSLANAGMAPLSIVYTLTATSAQGCTATDAVAVTADPVASASISPGGTATFCSGGSVLLTASGAPGSTYVWSTGATTAALPVAQAGSYSVVVTTAAGCSATAAATVVTALALPPTPTIAQATVVGGAVQLASSAATGNQWYRNGVAIAGATAPAYLVAGSAFNGAYTVVATSAAGCASAPSAALAVTVLGTAAATAATPVQLYPNPTSGRCTVAIGGARPAQVQVLNALGQVVCTPAMPTTTFDLSGLARGVYAVRVQFGAEVVVKRLVLE